MRLNLSNRVASGARATALFLGHVKSEPLKPNGLSPPQLTVAPGARTALEAKVLTSWLPAIQNLLSGFDLAKALSENSVERERIERSVQETRAI
jgi:hypothetical protein